MLWARGSALPQGPPMVDLCKQSLAIARVVSGAGAVDPAFPVRLAGSVGTGIKANAAGDGDKRAIDRCSLMGGGQRFARSRRGCDLPRPSLNQAAGRCPIIARERSIGFTPHARDRRNRHEAERVLRKPARTCWTWGSPEVRDVLPGRAGRSSL